MKSERDTIAALRAIAARLHVTPERARRQAADELDAMRATILVWRRHWHDALEHEVSARLADPDDARAHERQAEQARSLAADDLTALHRSLGEIERRIAKPQHAVDTEMVKQARALLAEAERGPTEEMKAEAMILARARAGKGDRDGRWEQSAARENARRERAAPLLVHAGVVPLATPEERKRRITAAIAKSHDEQRAREHDQELAARRYRALVAASVSPLDFLELEVRCGMLPKQVVYSLDFWHGEARKRGLVGEDPVSEEVRRLESLAHSPRADADAQRTLLTQETKE